VDRLGDALVAVEVSRADGLEETSTMRICYVLQDSEIHQAEALVSVA
jgi:hypothetical protein